jgi:hypothetical protein
VAMLDWTSQNLPLSGSLAALAHKPQLGPGARAEDAEPFAAFGDRVRRFLEDLLARHPDETVLVVAHGGSIRVIHAFASGLDYVRDHRSIPGAPNCAVARYAAGDGKLAPRLSPRWRTTPTSPTARSAASSRLVFGRQTTPRPHRDDTEADLQRQKRARPGRSASADARRASPEPS